MTTMWTLVIDHKHGTNTTTHHTENDAKNTLLNYVHEWWENELPDTPIPDPIDEAAIETYFGLSGEAYRIDECPPPHHIECWTLTLDCPDCGTHTDVAWSETTIHTRAKNFLTKHWCHITHYKAVPATPPTNTEEAITLFNEYADNEHHVHLQQATIEA